MDGRVEPAVFLPRARFEALRAPRPFEAACSGLWSIGALKGLTQPVVAIVGTRAATPYGTRLAHAFALALGRAGCCIVSGLALGIDTAAHRGALEADAPTIGVLGCGHENFFPPRNLGLADQMLAAGGAVLSPFAPTMPALPHQFLERNGIVAALADVVVVIEAPSRSGALNTASWAAGRVPVLAVPGDVDRPHVQGCLALIRDGATLARSPEDVFEALGMPTKPAPVARRRPPADPLARELLAALRGSDGSLDALVAATGANAAAILASLAMLEIDGRVESRGGGTYATLDPR
jgi:DNA processing protein